MELFSLTEVTSQVASFWPIHLDGSILELPFSF